MRYEEILVAPELVAWKDEAGLPCALADARFSAWAEAGSVWAITRRKPSYRNVHLINLANQEDVAWNALRTPPTPLRQLELSIEDLPPVRQVLLLTPDAALGRSKSLAVRQEGSSIRLGLSYLDVWVTIVCVMQEHGG